MASTSKRNVLHLLAASGNPTALDAIQNLLKTGQKHVNECEEEGLTALHVAAAWDNLATCQLLMFYGADPSQEDDNGRTPRDMAKGSVKKFFERLYETESSDRGKNVRHSFMRALRRLFFCASPMKAVKTPPPKRPRSWSPQYDGRENFLSEEEKRLRCAFRKNQAVGFGSEPPIVASVGQPLSPVGIPQPSGSFASSFHGSQPPASSALQRSAVATDKPDSDDNAAYATAEEYCSNYSHEMPRKTFSHYDSSDILSRGIESVKITSVPQWPKDWMTEESGSDETVSLKIPAEILRRVHQMPDNELKQELAKRGEYIGPLLESTRSVYQLKLARLVANLASSPPKLKYSWALESWMTGQPFPEGQQLDKLVLSSFARLSPEHWREGHRPTSFCYILIDPIIINLNSGHCTMREFVDSIFYIGKGKRSRPLQHLLDAVRAKEFGDSVVAKSKKLQRIINLWAGGHGVVSLHVFQNTVPVEAFTREAAMIDAIGLANLTNAKRGDYYGVAKSWTQKEKTIYGSYLLSNALTVFHVEGCREIYENDINGKQ